MSVDETIRKVIEAGKVHGKLYQMHKQIGLPYSWLKKLSYGEISDPGSKRIEKLKAYFEQEQAA